MWKAPHVRATRELGAYFSPEISRGRRSSPVTPDLGPGARHDCTPGDRPRPAVRGFDAL